MTRCVRCHQASGGVRRFWRRWKRSLWKSAARSAMMARMDSCLFGLQAAGAGGDLPAEWQALLAHQGAVLVAMLSRIQTAAATMRRRQPPAEQLQALMADAEQVQTVTVAIPDPDHYGRVVGEVLLPDGRSLNQELVRAGLAWWYRQYAPNDTTLAQLEAEARTAKRGLWADAHPVPPWEWRKGDREPART